MAESGISKLRHGAEQRVIGPGRRQGCADFTVSRRDDLAELGGGRKLAAVPVKALACPAVRGDPVWPEYLKPHHSPDETLYSKAGKVAQEQVDALTDRWEAFHDQRNLKFQTRSYASDDATAF